MERKQNLTIDDIARDLGVSKTTISRAISGKGRISNATRERVQAYIEKMNYRPSAAAKGLAESKTYNLALVLPKSLFKLNVPFIQKSMSAICEEAFLQDYNILLCLSTEDNPATLLRTLDNRKVDGVILSRTVENDILVDVLNQRGIPFSTMGSLPSQTKGLATVVADHDQVGGCNAFTVAFLGGKNEPVALFGKDMNYIVNQSRLAGFQKGIETLGLPEDKITYRFGLESFADCAAALDEALSNGIRRFLAMDEDLCMNMIIHIRHLGLQIPQDIKIGSFYDSELLSLNDPPISALNFDAAALGRAACRELLRHLRNEEYDPSPTLGYRILMR